MVRFADLRKTKILTPLVESDKPSRYKKEEKKPYILAYYALMSGTQKRQQRLKQAKIAKIVEAEKARKDIENADQANQTTE